MTRLRAQLRDQILVERVRERDVMPRIQVTEAEVDEALEAERREARRTAPIHIAQILVAVPEGADARVVAERRSRAEAAAARVRSGEPFEAVARQVSDASDAAQGGSLGLRPPSRLPALFVEAVRDLNPGDLAPLPVRSGAGFHVLKLIDRQAALAATAVQTRVRHILLRPTDRQPAAEAASRLEAVRRQIERGERRFEDVAREISEDGSAAQGGDLGWAVAGMMVPEFERAMDALPPGRVSSPVVSRFGVHLIEVLQRRQVEVDPQQRRDQVRAALRERKFAEAYQGWVRELRERAWVERRDPRP
jgi:peptidyl-prolyl cis-trans isomerase SurA